MCLTGSLDVVKLFSNRFFSHSFSLILVAHMIYVPRPKEATEQIFKIFGIFKKLLHLNIASGTAAAELSRPIDLL